VSRIVGGIQYFFLRNERLWTAMLSVISDRSVYRVDNYLSCALQINSL